MDRHLDFIKEHEPAGVLAERMCRYEVEPGDVRDVRMGNTITVQVGTDYHATKVVDDAHPVDDGASTIDVPARYRLDFLHDPDDALRNIAGISSAAIHPFIRDRGKLIGAFDRGTDMDLVPYVDIQDADLHVHGLPNWVADLMPTDVKVPRFIHVDLSKSKDRCGIAIIKPYSTINVPDPANPGVVKTVPTFAIECAITLTPSGNAHVEPADIRTWLIQLSTVHGINIGGVSYDGFQSQESLQMWRRAGVYAVEISVDRTMEQYEYFRASLYEDRVAFCQSEILMTELVMLEHDETANAGKGKVDHPPKGSKDISDAVCGAIYNCSRQRRYRTTTGYHREEGGMKVKVREMTKAGRPRTGQRPKSGSKQMARPTARPPQAERILLEEPPTLTETAHAPAWWRETHGLN